MKCDQKMRTFLTLYMLVDQGELVTSYRAAQKMSYKDKQVNLWFQKSIFIVFLLDFKQTRLFPDPQTGS